VTRTAKMVAGGAVALAVLGAFVVPLPIPGGGAMVRDNRRSLRRLLGLSTAQDTADYAAADAARAAIAARGGR